MICSTSNRQHINIVMDRVDNTVHDANNLYNITTSRSTTLSYYQLALHIRSVLANLQDSLSYIRAVSMHTMDYINAATTGTLSPHILSIMDLKQMLSHIEKTLPPTMDFPVSSEHTLHFYRYLHTHILIANRQFLLLIDGPIQDHTQQLSIYKIFTLDIPHGNFTAQPYTPRTQLPFPPDVHYKSGKLKASVYPNKLHQMCGYGLQHLLQ